jgi:ATP-binding cassette, subfamily C, bacterial exporter for protease/lipase
MSSVSTAAAVAQRPSSNGRRSALARALWTFRREFLWVGVFSFFANLLSLTPTLYMLQVFDRVMISGSGLTLLGLTFFTVLFFVCMGFAEWVRSRLLVRAGVKFDERLSGPVFRASFESRLQGSSAKPMQAFADLNQLRQFLTGNGTFAFFDTPWTLVYIGVLFLMHPVLGWSAVGFSLLLCTLAFVSQRLTTPRHEAANDAVVDTNNLVHAKLRNAEVVHALGMLGDLRRLWLDSYRRQLALAGRSQMLAHRLQATVKFVQYVQQSLMLAIAALLVIDGEIGVGAMVASNALMANALRPISTLVATWRQFVEARQGYARLASLLEEYPPRESHHVGDSVTGQITLKGLKAFAPHREQPILKGIDAEFQAGEVVAIVGPSGAGKSTLARCLVGIWPKTEGEVMLDGHPLSDWSREALGPHIGYLPQDIELFDGSIAENIARFGPLDSKGVIAAAQRTGIHDMVLRFPRGYDTPMGEAGALLSAGQRQRVGLARALYGNPQLVVLDEPNANLDDVGEAALIRAVRELRDSGSTVFLVVHQRAVLAACDRLLVLQDGAIAQFGRIAAQTAPTAASTTQALPQPPAQPTKAQA